MAEYKRGIADKARTQNGMQYANMKTTLIADAGSTKTDWAALLPSGANPVLWRGPGFNPNFTPLEEFQSGILQNLPAEIDASSVGEIRFYGAGVSPDLQQPVCEALRGVFPEADEVFAASDLLGAARALLGNTPGFAAILGTGMNSCIYDGKAITRRVPPLGFILGDEGSGACIGRMLLRDYARGNMPPDIYKELQEKVGGGAEEIIAQVYRRPAPNRYCASFAGWVGERRTRSPYCADLVKTAFRDFFRGVVSLYPDYREYALNCVGSVAFGCADTLGEVAAEFGMKTGRILKSPLEGLIKYHEKI